MFEMRGSIGCNRAIKTKTVRSAVEGHPRLAAHLLRDFGQLLLGEIRRVGNQQIKRRQSGQRGAVEDIRLDDMHPFSARCCIDIGIQIGEGLC